MLAYHHALYRPFKCRLEPYTVFPMPGSSNDFVGEIDSVARVKGLIGFYRDTSKPLTSVAAIATALCLEPQPC